MHTWYICNDSRFLFLIVNKTLPAATPLCAENETEKSRTKKRFLDHGWDSTAIDEKTWEERLARTVGQLANITMGLMVLPVSRNGVFDKVVRR